MPSLDASPHWMSPQLAYPLVGQIKPFQRLHGRDLAPLAVRAAGQLWTVAVGKGVV